jgi:hypothetical protein
MGDEQSIEEDVKVRAPPAPAYTYLVQPDEFVPAPIDFQQLELLGQMPPAQRVRSMLATENWIRAGIRGTLKKRFPHMSQRELNLRVLAYLTPLRGITVEELLSR